MPRVSSASRRNISQRDASRRNISQRDARHRDDCLSPGEWKQSFICCTFEKLIGGKERFLESAKTLARAWLFSLKSEQPHENQPENHL